MTQYLLGSWSELRSGAELLLNFGTKSGFRSGSRKGTKIRPFLENRNEIRSFSFRIFRSGSFRKGLVLQYQDYHIKARNLGSNDFFVGSRA